MREVEKMSYRGKKLVVFLPVVAFFFTFVNGRFGTAIAARAGGVALPLYTLEYKSITKE